MNGFQFQQQKFSQNYLLLSTYLSICLFQTSTTFLIIFMGKSQPFMSIFILFSTQSKCKLKKLRRYAWESNRGPQYRLKANFTNKFWETSHLQFKGTKSFIKNFLLKGEWQRNSVTRFGDLLDIGQLFKAHGNNNFAQSANTF